MNIDLSAEVPLNPLSGGEWIDSHMHLDSFDEAGLAGVILDRARAAGIAHVVAIGGSDEANDRALKFAQAHPGFVFATAGFDRDKAHADNDVAAARHLIQSNRGRVVGVGETGLDYHYEPESAGSQRRLFQEMLDLSAENALPVVIHSREADLDTLEMLASHIRNWRGDAAYPGVLHCFTGSYDFARKLLDLGYLISFSGILTFRNAEDLRDCARRLPLDRILIETDAPYLAPVPHRGKTNEPAHVSRVASTLASIRPDALQIVSRQTTENARRLFQLKQE